MRKLSLALFQKLTVKWKELTQLCVMLMQARLMMVLKDLNKILFLLNVCPDEIEQDSDEAYESDFS